ncbi:MAG: alpha-amylase family glycosyl hydrolase, partial [Promethearchaeota archaeon]
PHYEFYHFYSDDPESYDAWKNFKLLPRLNFTSDSLKNKIYRDEDSILQFWMRPPYNIDGWRFDCANMIGKYEKIDLSSTIWQDIHYNLKNINEDSLLLGETFYDGSELISPEKLDAITNYTAFYSPLVRWLSHQDGFQAFSNGMFRNFSFSYPFSLHDMISQMQLFRGLIPFQYQLIQLNLLDGHDVPRMYSVLKKDEEMMKMAVCMLFTYPGIPLIYYGDEIGMEGINDPANRRPMVWDESKWHKSLREFYIRMIKLRKDIVEFQTGSFFIFKLLPKYEKLEIITYARLSKNRCYLVILQKSSSKDSDSKQNNVEIEIPLWQLGYESGKIIGVIEKGKEGENLSKNYSSGIFRIENSKIFPYFIGEVI